MDGRGSGADVQWRQLWGALEHPIPGPAHYTCNLTPTPSLRQLGSPGVWISKGASTKRPSPFLEAWPLGEFCEWPWAVILAPHPRGSHPQGEDRDPTWHPQQGPDNKQRATVHLSKH